MKKKLFVVFLIFISGWTFGQEVVKDTMTNKEIRKARPTYIKLSVGKERSFFRDFATSPLFYKGKPMALAISRVQTDGYRTSDAGVRYTFGTYSAAVGEHTSQSSVKSGYVHYSQLHQIKKWSSEKYNIKVGGLFNATANFRQNAGLQNNAVGLEIVPTLFGSVKASRDISNTEEKNKKILFIKYKIKPRTRTLSYQLNIGLVNSSYRNGYIYAGQSSVLNKTKAFDGYEFKMFSGFRMSSSLDYTVQMENKNALQISYLWGFYQTGGDYDRIEFVNHALQLSLLFSTKK